SGKWAGITGQGAPAVVCPPLPAHRFLGGLFSRPPLRDGQTMPNGVFGHRSVRDPAAAARSQRQVANLSLPFAFDTAFDKQEQVIDHPPRG
ncbi:MAG TPA: hypothetical protein VIL46_01345, partial [Gemmataceae bacterium]